MAHPTATLRYLRQAPRKVRAVVDVIRGMPVPEAEAHLLLMPRRAALPILKLLRSAAANAKQTMKKDADALIVKEIRVDQGPKSTRWMPRARGAMSPIERKTSHVSITLAVREGAPAARFTIRRRETKRVAEEAKKHRDAHTGHTHEHTHEEKKLETDKKEKDVVREEGKEKGRGGVGGFAKRVFRRKAI